MRHAPNHWNTPPRRALLPLSALYGFAGRARFALIKPLKLSVPVICVGNIVAGGAGKTPVVIALVAYLKVHGYTPHILTRGYGGSCVSPVQVSASHTAGDVGDEALLLARHAPCWVDANRKRSGRLAIAAGADVLVMDDGFQNPALHKDLSLIVIDGGYGMGNGAVMPAGGLREKPELAFKRAHGVVVIGRDAQHVIPRIPKPLVLLRGVIHPQIPEPLVGVKMLAFCGIGRPQKFYDTLHDQRLNVVETVDFPDHHPYADAELEALAERAVALNATLVTTEKDWVRLSLAWQTQIAYVPITLTLEPDMLLARLCIFK
jgi:tetraacyldisaccharide 4'-kinase